MPRLQLVKCEHLDDWYTIELAEHDGRTWLERTGSNVMSARYSGRISDADVEGTAAEMLAIAAAIESRKLVSFRRCAVAWEDMNVALWSPRNSQEIGFVSHAEAIELAADIRAKLGGSQPP
jgi:hypothetical protein